MQPVKSKQFKNHLHTLICLFFVITFSISDVFAREIRKKTENVGTLQEIFYVSKKTKLRTGPCYTVIRDSNDTLVFGEFSNGIRSGVWTYFDLKSKRKSLQYNYNTDSILYIDFQFYPDSFLVQADSSFIYTAVDRPLIIIGYTEELRHQLSQKLVYPGNLPKKGKNGSLVICFSVDENGKITGSSVVESYNSRIEQRISAIVNQYNDRILPPVYNGKNVKSLLFVKANFYDYLTPIPKTIGVDANILTVDYKFKMLEKSYVVMHGYVFDTKRKNE